MVKLEITYFLVAVSVLAHLFVEVSGPTVEKLEGQRLGQFLRRLEHHVVDHHLDDQPVRRKHFQFDQMSKNLKHPHEELFERLAVQIGPHEHLPETLVVILVQQLQNPHQTGHQAPLETPITTTSPATLSFSPEFWCPCR
jgi:hypothetical protein